MEHGDSDHYIISELKPHLPLKPANLLGLHVAPTLMVLIHVHTITYMHACIYVHPHMCARLRMRESHMMGRTGWTTYATISRQRSVRQVGPCSP